MVVVRRIIIQIVVWVGSVYAFSKLSLHRLGSCHVELQRLMHAVMSKQEMDFSILCGFRDKRDQDAAVRRGNSKLCWPHGRHNHKPSLAVDVAAYPIDNFNKLNTERTVSLSKVILDTARRMQIPVYWGGHWTHLNDIYHYQLPEVYASDSVDGYSYGAWADEPEVKSEVKSVVGRGSLLTCFY